MRTIRETEEKLKKLRTEVDGMQAGRSKAIQGLIAQVDQLTAEIVNLKAEIDSLKKNKKDK